MPKIVRYIRVSHPNQILTQCSTDFVPEFGAQVVIDEPHPHAGEYLVAEVVDRPLRSDGTVDVLIALAP